MATKAPRRGEPRIVDRDVARLVLATGLGISTIRRAYDEVDSVRPDRLRAIELAAIENNIAPPRGNEIRRVPTTKTTTPTRGPGCGSES